MFFPLDYKNHTHAYVPFLLNSIVFNYYQIDYICNKFASLVFNLNEFFPNASAAEQNKNNFITVQLAVKPVEILIKIV